MILRTQCNIRFFKTKLVFQALKVQNNHSKKSIFFCSQNFAGGEFSPTLKLISERALVPLPTFLFPDGVIGDIFREKSSGSPEFATRDGLPAHKVYHTHKVQRTLVSPRKKHTYNKDATLIFNCDLHESLSFWNIKKYM